MEDLKEVALRIAREMNRDHECRDLGAISDEEAVAFASRLIAELQKDAEPAGIVKYQVGGPVVHILGDVKPGDLLYTRHQQTQDAEITQLRARIEELEASARDDADALLIAHMQGYDKGKKQAQKAATVPQEYLSLIANLAAVVRVQNGNKHADTSALLEHAGRLLSAPSLPAQSEGEQK